MPVVNVNGVRLAYEIRGAGDAVLLIAPAATRAAVWSIHQVPALTAAGLRVVTYDNRGSGGSGSYDRPGRLADLVDDAAGLIDGLGLAPCFIVGASLGALVTQELALRHPALVRAAALLGTRGRTDFFRASLVRAHLQTLEVDACGCAPTASDAAALTRLIQLFSPRSLTDDRLARDWLRLTRLAPALAGEAAHYEATLIDDTLASLSTVSRPCLVIGFADDVLMPPLLCREVADNIPGCRYAELADCGHFGFLERPAEVNRLLLEFFGSVP